MIELDTYPHGTYISILVLRWLKTYIDKVILVLN